MRLNINQIKPSPYQPRIAFNLEDIRGSVQKDGILVPITVRNKLGYYELIDGERRTRLARELGFRTVPVTVIDVDDVTARRMVWKVNTLRKDYTPKEKAYHFKNLQEQEGMSLRGIARECDYDAHAVMAHLNVLKLPQKYQHLVWQGRPLTVSHIRELEPYFNGNVATATLVEKLDLVIERKLTSDEIRKTIRPELEEIERKRVESAKKAVGKITTEVKPPETPDELDKAAQTLKREAKKKRDSTLTPKEKAEREAEKQRKKEEKKRKQEEKKRREEEKRKQHEEQIRKQVAEDTRLKLFQDKKFLDEAIKNMADYPLDYSPNEQSEEDASVTNSFDSAFDKFEEVLKNIDPKKFDEDPKIMGQSAFRAFKSLMEKYSFPCSICGNTKIVRECGHDL